MVSFFLLLNLIEFLSDNRLIVIENKRKINNLKKILFQFFL